MSEIFISYSSNDRSQAQQLTELLRSAGLSVWIDRTGIEVATAWSEAIVDAIDRCEAMIVLLSSTSIASHNVAKEVALASEKRKKILPLDLEPVELPKTLQYPLAGIQRTSMSNIDLILKALGRGASDRKVSEDSATMSDTELRKTVMVLPFEDLSPGADNQWFADGMVTELISSLSRIKALRVIDQQRTREYKAYKGQLAAYAREMGIRYFVQGAVRKFGEQIKINVTLVDINSGDHLWQDSMKGTMEDIFDIQERVADQLAEGLKVSLGAGDAKGSRTHRKVNSEAYEVYLRACANFNMGTQAGLRMALRQSETVLELAPEYPSALVLRATALAALYRNYDREPELLDEAERLCVRARELAPKNSGVLQALPSIYVLQGKTEEAKAAAEAYVELEPENFASYFGLAFFYAEIGQREQAIPFFEKALALKPDDLVSYSNLVNAAAALGDLERVTRWASAALPHFARKLRLAPDDESTMVTYANLLDHSGDRSHALEILREAMEHPNPDPVSVYNAACIYQRLNNRELAMKTIARAVSSGFRNLEILRNDPDLDGLRGDPEFVDLLSRVDPNKAA